MIKHTTKLLASAAVIAFAMGAATAQAETVVQKEVTTTISTDAPIVVPSTGVKTTTSWSTTEKPIVKTGTRLINLRDFDYNKNGILSRAEAGAGLFKLYDTDGNEVLDNNEFKVRAIITLAPMSKETVISYDLDGDGLADQTKVTYETFVRDTMLSRFDASGDGLSPEEFTGREFIVADINNDKVVDEKEWQASYDHALDVQIKAKANVNK